MFWTTKFAKLHWLEQSTAFCGDSRDFSNKEFHCIQKAIFRLHFGLQLSQCLVVLANTHIHPYTSSDCSKALLGSLFFQSVTVTFLFYHYQTADSSSCSFLWPQSSSHFTSTLGIARGCLKNYQSLCPPGKWPSTGEVASKSAPALTMGQNLVELPQFFPVLTIR